MGYAVYRDPEDSSRWAGYGVPAECDMPDCTTRIDRGMGYRCEEGHADEDADEGLTEAEADPEFEDFGCGLHFCEKHLYDAESHEGVDPKPDSIEWLRHMLTDDSWADWRRENPDETAAHRRRVEAA